MCKGTWLLPQNFKAHKATKQVKNVCVWFLWNIRCYNDADERREMETVKYYWVTNLMKDASFSGNFGSGFDKRQQVERGKLDQLQSEQDTTMVYRHSTVHWAVNISFPLKMLPLNWMRQSTDWVFVFHKTTVTSSPVFLITSVHVWCLNLTTEICIERRDSKLRPRKINLELVFFIFVIFFFLMKRNSNIIRCWCLLLVSRFDFNINA